MEIVWALMLMVCDTGKCMTQNIDTHENIKQCEAHKLEHELIPSDGQWKSVTFFCTIPGAKSI